MSFDKLRKAFPPGSLHQLQSTICTISLSLFTLVLYQLGLSWEADLNIDYYTIGQSYQFGQEGGLFQWTWRKIGPGVWSAGNVQQDFSHYGSDMERMLEVRSITVVCIDHSSLWLYHQNTGTNNSGVFLHWPNKSVCLMWNFNWDCQLVNNLQETCNSGLEMKPSAKPPNISHDNTSCSYASFTLLSYRSNALIAGSNLSPVLWKLSLK